MAILGYFGNVRNFSKILTKVRTSLLESDFITSKIGFHAGHTTAKDIMSNHTTELANTLFGKDENGACRPILVLDGTYIFLKKSSSDPPVSADDILQAEVEKLYEADDGRRHRRWVVFNVLRFTMRVLTLRINFL